MKLLIRAEVERQDLDWIESNSIKKIDDVWYAIGNEITCHRDFFIKVENGEEIECKYETRAIWFDFMMDSEGFPIFASLGEDGLGGDLIRYSDDMGGKESDIGDVVIFDESGGKMYYAQWEDYTIITKKY